MPLALKAILVFAIILIAFLTLWEVVRWARGRNGLAREQLRRRLLVGLALEITLLMWLFADLVIRPGVSPWVALGYLLVASLLILVPVVLAFQEMKFVARQYVRWHKEIIRDLARTPPPEEEEGDEPR